MKNKENEWFLSKIELERVKRIIISGVDIYYNDLSDDYRQFVYVIYNTGSKGKSAQDSVITAAAYDAYKNTTEWDEESGEVSYDPGGIDEGLFYDPSLWKRLTLPILNTFLQENKQIFVTDHNGYILEESIVKTIRDENDLIFEGYVKKFVWELEGTPEEIYAQLKKLKYSGGDSGEALNNLYKTNPDLAEKVKAYIRQIHPHHIK